MKFDYDRVRSTCFPYSTGFLQHTYFNLYYYKNHNFIFEKMICFKKLIYSSSFSCMMPLHASFPKIMTTAKMMMMMMMFSNVHSE
jgi:hypothetical protein